MRQLWRVVARVTVLTLHVLLGGFLRIAWLRLRHGRAWYDTRRGQRIIQAWMVRLCRILALRVEVDGLPCAAPRAMFAANHISWLDIIAINSVVTARFVAKDTVRHWPVFGALVAATGTLFIRRGSRRALVANLRDVSRSIDHAVPVVIFPEGTTTEGDTVRPFHAGLFQAAVDTGCRVQAIALCYSDPDQARSVAPFVGEDAFVVHLLRVLARRETRVRLRFARELRPPHGDRRRLAAQTRAQILALRDPAAQLRMVA